MMTPATTIDRPADAPATDARLEAVRADVLAALTHFEDRDDDLRQHLPILRRDIVAAFDAQSTPADPDGGEPDSGDDRPDNDDSDDGGYQQPDNPADPDEPMPTTPNEPIRDPYGEPRPGSVI